MKSILSTTALVSTLMAMPANADPTYMLGLALNFGGGETQLGVTAKVLSDDKPEEIVGAAGVSYFFDGSWGADVGVGYTFDDGAVTLGYDFLNRSPQVAVGWADIASVC